jgi:FRG domain
MKSPARRSDSPATCVGCGVIDIFEDPRIPLCTPCAKTSGLFKECYLCGHPIAYVDGMALPTTICFDCQRSSRASVTANLRKKDDARGREQLLATLASLSGRFDVEVRLRTDLNSRRPVPQLTVSDFSALAALREIFSSQKLFFRGQAEEYFRSGRGLLAPSMFRREEFYRDAALEAAASKLAFNHQRAASAWITALAEVVPSQFLTRTYHFRHNITMTKKDISVLAERPWILGVMQHYGYPTQLLDLTDDLDTAFWFATHRFAQSSSPGVNEYQQANLSYADPLAWPTVYIFGDQSIVDWPPSNVPVDRIQRPFAQHGTFLNVGHVEVSPFDETVISFEVAPFEASERIVAVLKLSPRLLDAIIQQDATNLFPPEDPFVQVLNKSRPIGFIPYA